MPTNAPQPAVPEYEALPQWVRDAYHRIDVAFYHAAMDRNETVWRELLAAYAAGQESTPTPAACPVCLRELGEHTRAVHPGCVRDLASGPMEDTVRLDWLDAQPPEDIAAGDEYKWAVGPGPFYEDDDLRGAVDAAMKEERAALAPPALSKQHERAVGVEQCTGPFSDAYDCPVHDPRKHAAAPPADPTLRAETETWLGKPARRPAKMAGEKLSEQLRDLNPGADSDKLQPYIDEIADGVAALEQQLADAQREIEHQRHLMVYYTDGVPIAQADWDGTQSRIERLETAEREARQALTDAQRNQAAFCGCGDACSSEGSRCPVCVDSDRAEAHGALTDALALIDELRGYAVERGTLDWIGTGWNQRRAAIAAAAERLEPKP